MTYTYPRQEQISSLAMGLLLLLFYIGCLVYIPIYFSPQSENTALDFSKEAFFMTASAMSCVVLIWLISNTTKHLYISIDNNGLSSRGWFGRHCEISWKDAIEFKHLPMREPYSGCPGRLMHVYTLVGKDVTGKIKSIKFKSQLIGFPEFFSQVNEMLDQHNIPRVEEVVGSFSIKRVTPPDAPKC